MKLAVPAVGHFLDENQLKGTALKLANRENCLSHLGGGCRLSSLGREWLQRERGQLSGSGSSR